MNPSQSSSATPNYAEEESWAKIARDINDREPGVVFYGFSGRFANKYSSSDRPLDELQALFFAGAGSESEASNEVPNIQFMKKMNFDKMSSEAGVVFEEISLGEVVSALRFGTYRKRGLQIEYQEPEEDELVEFDDDCNDDCQPGSHTCGK